MLRLNSQYNRLLEGGTRVETRLNLGKHRWRGGNQSEQLDAAGVPVRTISNDTDWRDNNVSLNGKATKLFAENHNVVAGMELESNQRDETRVTLDQRFCACGVGRFW